MLHFITNDSLASHLPFWSDSQVTQAEIFFVQSICNNYSLFLFLAFSKKYAKKNTVNFVFRQHYWFFHTVTTVHRVIDMQFRYCHQLFTIIWYPCSWGNSKTGHTLSKFEILSVGDPVSITLADLFLFKNRRCQAEIFQPNSTCIQLDEDIVQVFWNQGKFHIWEIHWMCMHR